MTYGDLAWRTSRLYLQPLTKVATRARGYGLERIPREGGCVLAVNHLAWIDIALVGALSPRNINYVAKVEVSGFPLVGRFLLWHGVITVRRGESDRDAVRKMREYARAGRAIGVFVEGTRQRSGRPGKAQPGAAMVAIQEGVPVLPMAVYGTASWRVGNFAPCSLAVGEPVRFDGLPKGGRGYKEATAEIERRIHLLFDWLAGVHARGRPRGETPPL
ncbi:MAG TPA: lysophospholipid acyltransferase family protein [Gaiellaceae bacterium]|nr:lysophospholipid acyltransferase family protein [Gaiellaceae bacterium]